MSDIGSEIICPICNDTRLVSKQTFLKNYKGNNIKNCHKCALKNHFTKVKSEIGFSAQNRKMINGIPVTKHKFYGNWQAMMGRCYTKSNNSYYRYGGRGISVCDEWKDSLIFLKWCDSFEHTSDKNQIDRIDNNGNYEPENCRLVSLKDNVRKRSTSKLTLEKANEIREMISKGVNRKEIENIFNISRATVSDIVKMRTWK